MEETEENLEKKRIQGTIIILSIMRDAVREVSVHKLYRSIEHRDEVYNTIIDTLEELEEDLEEIEYAEEEALENLREEREATIMPKSKEGKEKEKNQKKPTLE